MAGKTKSQKKKALDMRSKMYLVLALCSVMLLVSVGISLVLIGGIDLGGADAQSVSTVDSASMVVESGYDKEENTIDTQAYTSTILEQSADAGDSYVDETLFLGDSNTARMYRMFDYCSYDNAIGSVGMTAKSLVTFACVQVSTSSGYITMPQAVAKLQPRRVILTFGTNDLNPGYKAADFVKNYRTGIEAIVTAYPSVDIIVNAIPPIGQQHSNQSLTQTQVDEYNKALVEMCQEKDWKFLNSAEVLKDSVTGYAKSGYVETSDGIHLTRTAMDALFNYIRTHSYITEDDRPAPTTIPKHTGDKDAVVYTVPVVSSSSIATATARPSRRRSPPTARARVTAMWRPRRRRPPRSRPPRPRRLSRHQLPRSQLSRHRHPLSRHPRPRRTPPMQMFPPGMTELNLHKTPTPAAPDAAGVFFLCFFAEKLGADIPEAGILALIAQDQQAGLQLLAGLGVQDVVVPAAVIVLPRRGVGVLVALIVLAGGNAVTDHLGHVAGGHPHTGHGMVAVRRVVDPVFQMVLVAALMVQPGSAVALGLALGVVGAARPLPVFGPGPELHGGQLA